MNVWRFNPDVFYQKKEKADQSGCFLWMHTRNYAPETLTIFTKTLILMNRLWYVVLETQTEN
ncbi:hypothetical protein DZF79_05795 [Vibrio parahaemolyticus]|nr:hypothetical protein [Vibrio parahaemolyticus]